MRDRKTGAAEMEEGGGSKGGSATAGPASTKEEEHDVDLSGQVVVGEGGVEAGGREGKGVPSFPFALHMPWLVRQVVDGF